MHSAESTPHCSRRKRSSCRLQLAASRASALLLTLYSAAVLGCFACFTAPWTTRPLSVRRTGELTRVQRRFWQNTWIDKDYMERQFFVCGAIDACLPSAKPRAKLKAIELEPVDGRYISFLKPTIDENEIGIKGMNSTKKWYLDQYIAVGQGLEGSQWKDEGFIDKLKKEATKQGAKPVIFEWDKPTKRWDGPGLLDPLSIDMALLAEGALERLGSRLEVAFTQLRRVMKNSGRLYTVARFDEEEAYGGLWEEGMKGSVLDRAGFELVAAKQGECGLVMGYWRKKGAVAKKKKKKKKATGVNVKELSRLLSDDD